MASKPLNTGTSIVDYLKSSGQKSDYDSRSALATKYGIKNYTGSAEQNTQLLGFVNKPSTPATTNLFSVKSSTSTEPDNVVVPLTFIEPVISTIPLF
jgi:hypothetical protein